MLSWKSGNNGLDENDFRWDFEIMIPGTEHCKAWETKEWMKTLAIPEHLIGWPFMVCPLVGLIMAGISTWIY